MCPPGNHDNDIMAACELGHMMYGNVTHYKCRIALWSHQSAQTVSSEQCIIINYSLKSR